MGSARLEGHILHFIKAIFGENITINNNEHFRSNFNIEWLQKLVIDVDETLPDRKEDFERIKNLSTARFHKVEAKGFNGQEVEFFGKFILCRNNEDHFLIAEPGDIRIASERCRHLHLRITICLASCEHRSPPFCVFW